MIKMLRISFFVKDNVQLSISVLQLRIASTMLNLGRSGMFALFVDNRREYRVANLFKVGNPAQKYFFARI